MSSRGMRKPSRRSTGYESDASTTASPSSGSSAVSGCSSNPSGSACSSRPLSRCSSHSLSSSSRPVVAVRLHVYDLGNTFVTRWHNSLTKGYGLFHTAVEVYGQEWGYGRIGRDDQSGVFTAEPKRDPSHSYRETIEMGNTKMSIEEWDALITRLVGEWNSGSYHLLTQNCNHFSAALLGELQVNAMPEWCNNLAGQPGTMSSWLGSSETDFDAGKGAGDFYTGMLDWFSGDHGDGRHGGDHPQLAHSKSAFI